MRSLRPRSVPTTTSPSPAEILKALPHRLERRNAKRCFHLDVAVARATFSRRLEHVRPVDSTRSGLGELRASGATDAGAIDIFQMQQLDAFGMTSEIAHRIRTGYRDPAAIELDR